MNLTSEQRKEVLDKALDQIADLIAGKIVRNIRDYDIWDTGALAQSVNVERKFLEKKIVIGAPYAKDIEYGTPPHKVSYEDIRKWVERKLGIHGKGASRFAKNIVDKIEREGTDPQPFVRPALREFTK